MNGDIYRLREELVERIIGLEQAIGLLEANADYGKVLAERIMALEANKCNCNNKATLAAVKELRSALPG